MNEPYVIAMTLIFIVGYALIALEHITKVNKTAVALVMAVLCWMLQFLREDCTLAQHSNCLREHISDISQIVFFLLCALAIVEVITIHNGFRVITDFISVRSKKELLWITGVTAFFLSSILDNLTTTIVMVSLLQTLVNKGEDRLLIGGGLVIAANAGGAWTPIGDITTTMLWIGGQLSTASMVKMLFLPSVVSAVVSLAILSLMLKGNFHPREKESKIDATQPPFGSSIFSLGIGVLVSIPFFKVVTGLPPYMGALLGLGLMWVVTDWIHGHDAHSTQLQVPKALSKIDLSSVLFFLGILLCIDALDAALILDSLAVWLNNTVGNTTVIATLIGLVSAIVDNVPLVAASMSMYGLERYPQDSAFWNLVAFCAGTGGSILIIGSAAGVVYMGLEKVNFFWYIKRISLAALIGYFAGIATYLVMF